MRITLIPSDKTIGIDNEFYRNIEQDFSWIPSNIHAVQWYDTWGEIEYIDGSPNKRIEELGIFEQAVLDFNNEKERIDTELEALNKENEEKKILEELALEVARNYWKEFRNIRDSLLSRCDWTQSPDSPLTEEKKDEWATYRQILRDLPVIISDPKPMVNDLNHENWPTKPD